MIRGTTPILTFRIKTDLDLSEIDIAEITFKSVGGTKEKTWDNKTRLAINPVEKTIQLQLTQEETLYFFEGKINIQLRIKMQNNMVYASKVIQSSLDKILKEREI